MRSLHACAAIVVSAAATLVWLANSRAEAPRRGDADTGRSPAKTDRAKPDREDETVQVARLIDSVIQPRFLKDAGEFGVRRLATIDGHEPVVFQAESKTEKKVLDRVDAFARDYFVAFLHMAHKPGKYLRVQPGGAPRQTTEVKPRLTAILTAKDARREEEERLTEKQLAGLLKVAVERLPKLREGKETSTSFEKWGVTMRPVLARKSCLDCHAGAKAGDTLGVMVYAVEKNAAKTPRDPAAGGD